MLCEHCKERPASVLFTQETAGGSRERQLCDKCAFQHHGSPFESNQEPLSIQQLLSHWFGGADPFQAPQRVSAQQELECPDCHLTFSKFLDIGKFGCATCYDTFREQLPRVFGKFHNGHSTHSGKIPVTFNDFFAVKRKIEDLRLKMQEAVAAERFEEAAAFRDEANALKEQLENGGEMSDVD